MVGIDQRSTIPGFTNVPGGVDVELYAGLESRLANAGDEVWLHDADMYVVDWIAWGSAGGPYRNTQPPPSVQLWDSGNETALQPTAAGQSISLTPNGLDTISSYCWELTGSASAGEPVDCLHPPATIDTDSWGIRVTSLGRSNN